MARASSVGKGAAAAAGGGGGMGASGGGKVKSVTGRGGDIAAVGGGQVLSIMEAEKVWLAPAERCWESRTGVVPTALAAAVAPAVVISNELFGHHSGVAQWGYTAVVFVAFRYIQSSRAARAPGGSVTQQ